MAEAAPFDLAALPHQVAMARIGFAAQAFLTPKLATPFVGAKRNEMTPSAMAWAGLFASREAALGAFTLASEGQDPESRRKVLLLNAFVDALDVASALFLSRRQRSIKPLLVLAPLAALSVVAHLQAAQQLRSA